MSRIAFEYDERNRRLVSSCFVVQKRPDVLWRYLRMACGFLRHVPSIASAETQHVDANTQRVVAALIVSRTLNLRVSAELEVTFDDATRTMHVETLKSRWGTYTATLHVVEDDSTGAARVNYASSFDMLTLFGMRLPFVDAKLLAFTEQVVRALQSSVVKTSWRADLHATFDELVVATVLDADDLAGATRFPDIRAHLERLLRYTVVGGKAYRALLVRLTTEGLLPTDAAVAPERVGEVHAMGWVVEMLQAMALIADDIMDGSKTRRGKPCWHVEVGVACAINDALLVYSATYRLLAQEFVHDAVLFGKLAQLVFDTAMQTCVGQLLDTTSEGVLERATTARYDAIVRYKTTYYTIYTPLAAGVLLARLPPSEEADLLENAREVSIHIGQLFQEQDDYLDVYGDSEVTGKVGTDIVDGKTTWMLAHALERADDEQRAELQRLYGADKDVPRVKELFDALGVHDEYERRQRDGARACLACAHSKLHAIATTILAELVHRTA